MPVGVTRSVGRPVNAVMVNVFEKIIYMGELRMLYAKKPTQSPDIPEAIRVVATPLHEHIDVGGRVVQALRR